MLSHIFQDLVDSLSLVIRLWVIGRTINQVSLEKRVQLLPKASDKLREVSSKPTMKSMLMSSHFQFGTLKGCNRPLGFI
jgi:hypothetical protein